MRCTCPSVTGSCRSCHGAARLSLLGCPPCRFRGGPTEDGGLRSNPRGAATSGRSHRAPGTDRRPHERSEDRVPWQVRLAEHKIGARRRRRDASAVRPSCAGRGVHPVLPAGPRKPGKPSQRHLLDGRPRAQGEHGMLRRQRLDGESLCLPPRPVLDGCVDVQQRRFGVDRVGIDRVAGCRVECRGDDSSSSRQHRTPPLVVLEVEHLEGLTQPGVGGSSARWKGPPTPCRNSATTLPGGTR